MHLICIYHLQGWNSSFRHHSCTYQEEEETRKKLLADSIPFPSLSVQQLVVNMLPRWNKLQRARFDLMFLVWELSVLQSVILRIRGTIPQRFAAPIKTGQGWLVLGRGCCQAQAVLPSVHHV